MCKLQVHNYKIDQKDTMQFCSWFVGELNGSRKYTQMVNPKVRLLGRL